MKKTIQLLMIALAAVTFVSCGKDDDDDNGQTKGEDYYYNLYTEYENYNVSDMSVFDVLYDINSSGDPVTWMHTYRGTREECDRRAIAAFDSIISLIDEKKAGASLHGSDYMKAVIQRLEGGPKDLKSKTWRSAGAE